MYQPYINYISNGGRWPQCPKFHPPRLLQQPRGHARHALLAALARRQPRAGRLLGGRRPKRRGKGGKRGENLGKTHGKNKENLRKTLEKVREHIEKWENNMKKMQET